MVCEMGNKWPYNSSFPGFYFKDSIKTICIILVTSSSRFFPSVSFQFMCRNCDTVELWGEYVAFDAYVCRYAYLSICISICLCVCVHTCVFEYLYVDHSRHMSGCRYIYIYIYIYIYMFILELKYLCVL